MFDVLGALLAIYTAYAVASGRVFAKSRATGRTVGRCDEPAYFWTVVSIYAALAAALVFWF